MKHWLLACGLLMAGCSSPLPEAAWEPDRPRVAALPAGSPNLLENQDQALRVGRAPAPRTSPRPRPRMLQVQPLAVANPPSRNGGSYPSSVRAAAAPTPPETQPLPESVSAPPARDRPGANNPDPPLQVTTETSTDGLSGRNSNQILYALVEVTPHDQAPVNAAGTDVALVMDVSGSMAGPGLATAAAAAAKIYAQAGPLDRAWLIGFADEARLLIDGKTPRRPKPTEIHQLLERAKLGEGTFMSGAAELAATTLRTAGTGKSRHIVLITDGFAADPEYTREVCERAWEQGISVSCVGIGACDGALLQSIASACNGRFYAVQSGAGLPQTLATEGRLTQLIVLRDVRVCLQLAPGVTLRRAFRPKPLREVPSEGNPCLVRMGDIHRGENLQLLLEIEVKPGTGKERSLAQVDVLSRDPDGSDRTPQRLPELKVTHGLAHPQANSYVMKLVDDVYLALQRR